MIRPKRLPRDPAARALEIVRLATGQTAPPPESTKSAHAVAIGRLGGKKGGKARALALSARRRKAIAKKAAAARWHGR
jgi:hypothetical protein